MYNDEITRAEEHWLYAVYEQLDKLFSNHWLPSHDIQHHTRVWRNACRLSENLEIADPLFFEQLLLACFFHDVGLLADPGDLHGTESRKACELFLQMYSGQLHFDTTQMLSAIEKHDDKKYGSQGAGLLYEILTVADDLDAFGAIGAYRYIEIYLLRKMEEAMIPQQVLMNAEKRFTHCIKFMKDANQEIKLVEKEYTRLVHLFSEGSFKESPEVLVNWIKTEIVMQQRDPVKFLINAKRYMDKGDRIEFFTNAFLSEMCEKQEPDLLSY